MPKFAANLSLLFAEVPFLERFAAARAAGFSAVECQTPYGFSVQDIAARLHDNGLQMVLHNLPPGNWDAGDRGIACDPARTAEFRDGVARGIEYASTLNCTRINCLAGILPQGVERERARATLAANLAFAAGEFAKIGARVLVEPINFYDIPGFFINRFEQALDVIAQTGSKNLQVQYDIYHAQRMQGELGNTLTQQLRHIGHIQIADNPGRHEPGTGEINYPWLFDHIDALGYEGWVGCEYLPLTTTIEGLGWMPAVQAQG
jgi:hydroxypyruvate isomerase